MIAWLDSANLPYFRVLGAEDSSFWISKKKQKLYFRALRTELFLPDSASRRI